MLGSTRALGTRGTRGFKVTGPIDSKVLFAGYRCYGI